MFGNPETTTGGNALKFFASIRLDVRRIENIKGKDEEIIGSKTRVKCVKNKVFAPGRETIVTINYNEGINIMEEIISLAVDHNIVNKSGSWYTFEETKLGQGMELAIEFLKNNIEVKNNIEKLLMNKLNNKN
jgi:recombination protein RecA